MAGLRSLSHARVLRSGMYVVQCTPVRASHVLVVTCAQCVVQTWAGFTGNVTARTATCGCASALLHSHAFGNTGWSPRIRMQCASQVGVTHPRGLCPVGRPWRGGAFHRQWKGRGELCEKQALLPTRHLSHAFWPCSLVSRGVSPLSCRALSPMGAPVGNGGRGRPSSVLTLLSLSLGAGRPLGNQPHDTQAAEPVPNAG